MIFINKNSENTVALSLSDTVTLTGDTYFLFQFTDIQSRDEVTFTGLDTSSNTDRYNLFNIIETGSTDTNLTASTINLVGNGYYDYRIYQMSGQTNTSVNDVTGGPIQYGKVLVSGDTINHGTQYEYTGSTDERFVYAG